MKAVVFHPEAREEYIATIQYYSDIRRDLGDRLHRELERLTQAVCRDPRRFSSMRPPTRRALARTFPYAIVYVDLPDVIWIVAVMHGKRQPEYWRKRLKKGFSP